jgi:hypothetical protein
MASRLEVDVEYRGKFLLTPLPSLHNESEASVHSAVQDLVAFGEREVKSQLYPGHGYLTGHYSDSVHGEMSSTMHALLTDSGVTYGPWLEGVSSRNEASRFKGYGMFRRALAAMREQSVAYLFKSIRKLTTKLNSQ